MTLVKFTPKLFSLIYLRRSHPVSKLVHTPLHAGEQGAKSLGFGCLLDGWTRAHRRVRRRPCQNAGPWPLQRYYSGYVHKTESRILNAGKEVPARRHDDQTRPRSAQPGESDRKQSQPAQVLPRHQALRVHHATHSRSARLRHTSPTHQCHAFFFVLFSGAALLYDVCACNGIMTHLQYNLLIFF